MMSTSEPTAIYPGTREGNELGLDATRFGPSSLLYQDSIYIIFSNLDIVAPEPRKVLHDLTAQINLRGLIAVIPHSPRAPIDYELLEWGFVLQTDHRNSNNSAYYRGTRGIPLVSAKYKKYATGVDISDDGCGLGFRIIVTTLSHVMSISVDPDRIITETREHGASDECRGRRKWDS